MQQARTAKQRGVNLRFVFAGDVRIADDICESLLEQGFAQLLFQLGAHLVQRGGSRHIGVMQFDDVPTGLCQNRFGNCANLHSLDGFLKSGQHAPWPKPTQCTTARTGRSTRFQAGKLFKGDSVFQIDNQGFGFSLCIHHNMRGVVFQLGLIVRETRVIRSLNGAFWNDDRAIQTLDRVRSQKRATFVFQLPLRLRQDGVQRLRKSFLLNQSFQHGFEQNFSLWRGIIRDQ